MRRYIIGMIDIVMAVLFVAALAALATKVFADAHSRIFDGCEVVPIEGSEIFWRKVDPNCSYDYESDPRVGDNQRDTENGERKEKMPSYPPSPPSPPEYPEKPEYPEDD